MLLIAEGLMRAMPGITVADGGGRFSENNNVITTGLNVDPSATDRRFSSIPMYQPTLEIHRYSQILF